MLRILRTGTLTALCLAAAPLMAVEPNAGDLDTASTHSADAVERASRLSRDANFTDKLEREAERALSAAGRASPDRTPDLSVPEIDDQALARARKDIEALLADPRLAVPNASASEDSDPHPLIFISFSLPEDSLRALLAEAGRTGSPLVLRGLVDNSMQRTTARLGELLGPQNGREASAESTPSLAIDPTLFERFDVDKVPAFVLPQDTIAPCTPEGCPVPEHLKVAGDVSLAYALGVMAREAGGTILGDRAEQWRQRLEVRP
ncbi:type-F conjugative transfer system pilin assembly protein TrbC [Sedimenticola hydrogenitrophicus]|uniref:type-F conjugative transfer system pilin assembly protein TrbC n=1 Tax=Sedimenticola hydrogenitrophicus TaxID=2967975 RepID=UPI0023B143DE|nr:type-F conjugative transfer system pilin assembly protein TrbC [Sedimenticola hydrogenitrophicus]